MFYRLSIGLRALPVVWLEIMIIRIIVSLFSLFSMLSLLTKQVLTSWQALVLLTKYDIIIHITLTIKLDIRQERTLVKIIILKSLLHR